MKSSKYIRTRVRPNFHRLERFRPMADEFQAYLTEELHRPRSTVTAYMLGLNNFLHYLGEIRKLDIGPENVDRQIALDYLEWARNARGFKTSTSSLYFTSVHLFFRWAHSAGKVREFILLGVPKLKVPTSLPNPISPKIISKILKQPNLETLRGARDLALMEILYGSGLRCMEVLNLRFSDIQRDTLEGYAQVRVLGKGNKQRLVPLTDPALKALSRYTELRFGKRQGEKIFLGDRGRPMTARALQRRMAHYGQAAGLNKVHPHRFRHSMASHLLANNVPIEIISELLGHTNLNTTRIYAQVTPVLAFSAYRKAGFREKLPV